MLGWFSQSALAPGWFDETAQPAGWFDRQLLDTPPEPEPEIEAPAPQHGRRPRRWRPLPEWLPELPEAKRAELPKVDPAAVAAAVVAEFRERAQVAAKERAYALKIAAMAENLAAQRRLQREAWARLARAERLLAEAQAAADAHMARLREEDEWLLAA